MFQGGQQGKACASRPCPVCTLLTGKDENRSHLVSSRLLADLWPFPLVPRSRLALIAWPPAGRASSMTSGIGRPGLLNVMPTVTICTLLCTSTTYPLLLTCGWKKEESGSVSIAFHRNPSLRKELQCPARLSVSSQESRRRGARQERPLTSPLLSELAEEPRSTCCASPLGRGLVMTVPAGQDLQPEHQQVRLNAHLRSPRTQRPGPEEIITMLS